MQRSSQKKDTRNHLLAGLVLLITLLLASAPYIYGDLIRPAGTRFWAVAPVNSGDANQYLAFTRIAADGHLLVGDPFTTEPHTRRLFLPQVVFQAGLCRLFGWTPIGAFQASRVLSGALLLAVAWWFGTLLLPHWRPRWIYLGLLCFSAGAGWFLSHSDGFAGWVAHLSGLHYGPGPPPRIENGDWYQPEGNTFATLGNLPHLPLSSALLTAIVGALLAYERGGRRRWLGLTLAASMLLSWTHPFDYVTLVLVVTPYFVVRWMAERQLPVRIVVHGGAWVLGALPAAIYLVWLTSTSTVYHELANDRLKVQGFWYYALAHGFLMMAVLPVLGHPRQWRRFALPLCWVLAVFLFLLTPFRLGGKQPRLVGGVHVPLALLAAVGIDATGRWLARVLGGWVRPARRVVPVLVPLAFLLLTATGVWGLLERHASEYARRGPDYYQSPGVQEVFRVIDREGSPAQVTLGGAYTGGWAPTWADTTSFAGHWHMTLNVRQKEWEREVFYTGQADPLGRALWLRQRGITWIIWYPWEWSANGRSYAVVLDNVPGLQRRYTAPDVILYRFSPEILGNREGPGPPGGGEDVRGNVPDS